MQMNITKFPEVYNEVFKLPDFCIEITEEESAVLCGLIKEHMPRKIVELGTAEGGSACLILRCLEKLGLTTSVFYSIDLFEKLWNDDTKETGYLLNENADYFSNFNKFRLMLGKYAVDRIGEIGNDIDFVFLDTTHHIPGEILDFLLLFPHLAPNAIIVLHDANLHNMFTYARESICTRVLFNTVKAEKYYFSEKALLNLGVFQIMSNTVECMEDVFATLLLPWSFRIDKEILDRYYNEYKKYYSETALSIWENAIECAENSFSMEMEEVYLKEVKRLDIVFSSGKRIFVYGCGYRGTILLEYLRTKNYEVQGLIISDKENIEKFNGLEYAIYHYSEIRDELDASVTLIATASLEVRELLERNAHNTIDIDGRFFEFVESGR